MKKRPIYYDGVIYPSRSDLARAIGKTYQTIVRRLVHDEASGMDTIREKKAPGRAPKPKKERKDTTVYYDGVAYPSRRALARSLGFSVNTIRQRTVYDESLGINVFQGKRISERKVGRKVGRKGHPVMYNGTVYPSQTALAQHLGVRSNTVNRRTVYDEAAGMSVLRDKKPTGRPRKERKP